MSADEPPADPDVARLFAPVAVEETFAGVLTEAAGLLGQIDDPVDAELWGSDLIGALAASAGRPEALSPAPSAGTWAAGEEGRPPGAPPQSRPQPRKPWLCCGSWPRSARPACEPPPGRPRPGYRPAAWPIRP